MLRKEDVPGVPALATLLGGQSFIPIHYVPAEIRHEQAVYGIGALGEHSKVLLPDVVLVYRMSRSPSSQCAAARVIAGIGPDAKPALPVLLKGLSSTNELVLSDTIYAILRVNMAAPEPALVVPALTNFLYNPSTNVRIQAAAAIGFFGRNAKSALPHLLPLANDPDPELVGYALQALERIEPGITLEKRCAIELNIATDIRETQAALGTPYPKEMLAGLVQAYQGELTPEAQCKVAAVLAEIGPEAKLALPALLKGLGSTNELVLAETIYAILRVNMAAPEPALVVPALTNFLTNPSPLVRARTVEALWLFGTNAKPAFPHLLPLVNDADPKVASFTLQALHRIDPGFTLEVQRAAH